MTNTSHGTGSNARAGGIGRPLVVAADHGAGALVFHRHLGAAQHMAGRAEPDAAPRPA